MRACEIYTYVRYACVNGHVAKACLNSFVRESKSNRVVRIECVYLIPLLFVLSSGRRFVLHNEGRQLHPDLEISTPPSGCDDCKAIITVPDLFVLFMTSPRERNRSPEAFCLVQSAPWYRAVTSGYSIRINADSRM